MYKRRKKRGRPKGSGNKTTTTTYNNVNFKELADYYCCMWEIEKEKVTAISNSYAKYKMMNGGKYDTGI